MGAKPSAPQKVDPPSIECMAILRSIPGMQDLPNELLHIIVQYYLMACMSHDECSGVRLIRSVRSKGLDERTRNE